MKKHNRLLFLCFAAALLRAAPARPADALELLREHSASSAASGLRLDGKMPHFTGVFDNAPFGEAVREISRRGNANVVFSPGVAAERPVTLSFTDVPWRSALESLLKAHGCAVFSDADAGILRIATLAEAESRFETRSRPLRYVQPDGARFRAEIVTTDHAAFVGRKTAGGAGMSLLAALEGVASEGGSVVHESRTNTLILRDTPVKIQEMLAVVDEIDVPPSQVLIETCILSGRDGAVVTTRAPRILVLDNEEASVFIGNVVRTQGGREVPLGVQLLVIPHVCGGTDQVILEIIPKQTDARGGAGGALPDAMDVKMAHTTLMLRSGETGTVAGLFGDGAEEIVRSASGLGKVPGVGRLFRQPATRVTQRDTRILVTATIVPPDHEEDFDRDVEAIRKSIASSL